MEELVRCGTEAACSIAHLIISFRGGGEVVDVTATAHVSHKIDLCATILILVFIGQGDLILTQRLLSEIESAILVDGLSVLVVSATPVVLRQSMMVVFAS